MYIRKRSIANILLKIITISSILLLFSEPLNIIGFIIYFVNIPIVWLLATINTYYVK